MSAFNVEHKIVNAMTQPLTAPADWASLYTTLEEALTEIKQLKTAIRRPADQDATLSVVGGNVIVEMTPGVVQLPALDPNAAPGWNAAIGAVREALADAGVEWDTV